MIIKPIFIIGAPRSGTSMLFHILRTSQAFWSLPSEGFHIWNTLCHPSLHNWISEQCDDPDAVSEDQKEKIRTLYEQQSMPSWFWRYLIKPASIWRFNSTSTAKLKRKLQGNTYTMAITACYYLNPVRKYVKRRVLDKSLGNCLRLDLVKTIFPDAKFIYIKRHGLASIKSLINSWLNPDRFITFYPPEPIKITGYDRPEWKFIMPEGWRQFNNRHLAELCLWQWKNCHEHILSFKQKNPEIFLDVKMEEMISKPGPVLEKIAAFTEVPYIKFAPYLSREIPQINETPEELNMDFPFPEYLQNIKIEIQPIMEILGYE
ncbi:MAG: sulfotransferase [Proteobacteria bacterium]|nr:sulfotransferase [Pseudomonadota bacterium]